MNIAKPKPVEIDAGRVAAELGLDVSEFRTLMEQGHIAVLCERGTGEDEGTLRASFYYGRKRARFLIDREGIAVPA